VKAIQDHPNARNEVSVTVIQHADGTFSVGVSGAGRRAAPGGGTQIEAVVAALNAATQPRADGQPLYRTGPPPNIPGLLPHEGSPRPNNCSEPHAANVAALHPSDSPAVGYQTVWAGADDTNKYPNGNPPARTSASGPTTMCPCGTCSHPPNASITDSILPGKGRDER
jgi:hypothetical protein